MSPAYTPDPSGRRAQSDLLPSGSIDMTLRVLGTVIVVLLSVSETVPTLRTVLENAPQAAPAVWLLAGTLAATAVAVVVDWRRRWVPWLLLASLVTAHGLMVGLHGAAAAADLLVPGYWALTPVLVAMRSLPRRQYLVFALVAAVGMAASMVVADWSPSLVAFADLLWIATPIAEVTLFCDTLLVLAHARDRSIERHRRAEEHRAIEEAEAQANREAARMLHDHVLHALHALSRADEPRLAIDECRQAHEAVTTRPRATGTARVEELLLDDPVLELAGAEVVGHTEGVPLPVVQAVVAAAHEALNNVVRHAKASNVSVVLEQHDQSLTVRVHDDGVGFDPRQRRAGRLGMGESILQRMDDVGGLARTISRPGQGTTVELVWPRPGEDPEWRQAPDTVVRRRLTLTAVPSLVAGTIMSVLGAWMLPAHQWQMMLFGLAVMAVGGCYAVVLRRRPLRPTSVALLCTIAVLAWLVALAAAPQPLRYDYQVWLAWGATALLHLVIVSARASVGAVIVGAWTVIQVAGVRWLTQSWSRTMHFSSIFMAGAGDIGVALLTLVAARRFAGQQALAARIGTQVRTATARLVLTNQLDQFWSRRVTEEALPLMQAVAEGELAPTDPEVRSRARVMEASLRDELVLGPGQPELLQALANARQAGWALASTLGPDDAPELLLRAQALLEALGAPAHPEQTITISASRRATAVVLGASEPQQQALRERVEALGGSVDVDPDFVRLAY